MTPSSNERQFREFLARKISGVYWGLWFLVPEHLRLGSWDLLKSWSAGDDRSIDARLALQMVHESALCVSGIRPVRSLCHQGFEVLNGLSFIATDKTIHQLLDSHTIVQAQYLQIALAKLRRESGHYQGQIFAFDPHRINTYSKRIMPAKKANPKSPSQKVFQTFFVIDAQTGQPILFASGSPGAKTSKTSLKLFDMLEDVFPQGGLAVADTEHASVEILNHILADSKFEILMPMAKNQKIKRIMADLEYERKWAGYALAKTSYQFTGMGESVNLIIQRTGEREEEFRYQPFVSTFIDDMVKMLTEEYPERWTIEEFFNFEAAMGWDKARTMNLNIRYGKMTMALIAQAVCYQFRQKLPKPYKQWTAKHLADSIFRGIDGDLRVKNDTIIVTLYNVPEKLNLRKHYENLPEKLEKEGFDPKVPWLYNFKLDFRFK